MLVSVLALVALVHGAAVTAAPWLRADSHNFIVYSSGNSTQLREYAGDLEKFNALLCKLFKVAPNPHPNRLTIYLLSGQEKVTAMAGDSQGSVAGFYRTDPMGTFAVGHHEDSVSHYDLSGQAVLLHEYAHHFMFHNSAFAYPTWYVEGFAEFVSSATFDAGGGWTLGRPLLYRAGSLLNYSAALPIAIVLTNESGGGDLFYGKAWLLVHMLRNTPARSREFDSYLRTLARGKSANEAAAEFGDLDKLERDLEHYMRSGLRYVRSTDPLAFDPTISLTTLDAVHGRLLELTIARRNSRDPVRTRDALARLAEANPALALAWLELALAEDQLAGTTASTDAGTTASDATTETKKQIIDTPAKAQAKAAARATARVAVDRALAIEAGLARAAILKADLRANELVANANRSPTAWREVRDLIITANRANTEDPVPLVRWYETFGHLGTRPDQAARDGLTKAFLLEPEVPEVRIELAFNLAAQGKFDEAIALVEYLARDPHGGKAGTAVLAQLQRMHDLAATLRSGAADNS